MAVLPYGSKADGHFHICVTLRNFALFCVVLQKNVGKMWAKKRAGTASFRVFRGECIV